MSFEYFQVRRFHSLSGQTVHVWPHSFTGLFFFCLEYSFLQLGNVTSPFTVHFCEDTGFFFCYIFYHSHSIDSWKLQLDILLLVFGLNIRSSSLSFLPISHDINCFTSSTIVFAVHWTHSSLYLSEMLRSPQLDTLHSKVCNVHLLSSAFSESIEQMEKINLPLLLPSIAI